MERYRSELWLVLGVALLTLVCYARTLAVPFVFDDVACIQLNPLIRDFGNFLDRDAPFKVLEQNQQLLKDTVNNFVTRPLSYLTFAVNYRLHGESPAGYHLVNILVHLGNVLFVYLLARGLVSESMRGESDEDEPTREAAVRIGFLVAALFAVHPIMTNAVTYLTQRMTSLVALFYLATLLLYRQGTREREGKRQWGLYLGALACCIAAMLTKETAFTLPLTLVLYDLVFATGTVRQRLGRLAPFLLTLLIIPCNVIALLDPEDLELKEAVSTSINLVNFNRISVWEYLLTQSRAVAFYFRLLLLPAGLSLEHDFRLSRSLADPAVLASLALHLCLIGWALRLLTRARRLTGRPRALATLSGFGILWFYLALSVESTLIPLNEMAVEHRTYLPCFGFFLALVCLAERGFRLLPALHRGSLRYLPWAPVLLLLTGTTMARNEVWRDPVQLWSRTVALYPKLARPYANLADQHIMRGALPEAAEVYRTAIREMPDLAILHFELGNVHLLAREYDAAIGELTLAIRMQPDLVLAHDALAKAFMYTGRHDDAQRAVRTVEGLTHGT